MALKSQQTAAIIRSWNTKKIKAQVERYLAMVAKVIVITNKQKDDGTYVFQVYKRISNSRVYTFIL